MFGERKKIESVQFQLLRHCVWAKVWAELEAGAGRDSDTCKGCWVDTGYGLAVCVSATRLRGSCACNAGTRPIG